MSKEIELPNGEKIVLGYDFVAYHGTNPEMANALGGLIECIEELLGKRGTNNE